MNRLGLTMVFVSFSLACGGLNGAESPENSLDSGRLDGGLEGPSDDAGSWMSPDAGDPSPPSRGLEIEATPAESEYLNHWIGQDHGEAFVSSLKWLPHYIHEQGELGICLRLDFRSEWDLDGAYLESIRQIIEERVWEWQVGLIGEPHWVHDEVTPVRLFGIAATDTVTLTDLPEGVPVYRNENAECPTDCFRFTYKHDEAPTYPDCEHPSMSHFDFNIWYSDFGFGAAGHGGDWGTRLDWAIFRRERSRGRFRVTDHELGHVAGLPDVYNYPESLNDFSRPDAIMAEFPRMTNLDYLMLRKVWEWGWARYYAP